MVVNGHTVDAVSKFIYFGSKKSSHANSSVKFVRRIALAVGVMNDLDDVLRQRSVRLHTKFRFYSACPMTAFLYYYLLLLLLMTFI